MEGDAEALPFPDASFDVVLSTLGVMFAPDQERAAAELLRVCRPGGVIGLTCWTPAGFIGQLFAVVGRYAPPPPGLKPASRWGTEAGLRELLGDGVASLQVAQRAWPFRFPSARFYQEYFRSYYGPTARAFAALDRAGQERLAVEIEALVERFNRSGDATMIVPADYLEVVAVRG
jgi:ubiquinone/menaquinone biosynthesis C-methylase UbiE